MKAPNIQKASTEELLDGYRKAAVAHRTASRRGNHVKANKAHAKLTAIFREVRSRSSDTQDAFVELLNDRRIEIRGWAGAHALQFAPSKARRVLRAIARGKPSVERLSAEMVLEEWKAGRLSLQ